MKINAIISNTKTALKLLLAKDLDLLKLLNSLNLYKIPHLPFSNKQFSTIAFKNL